MIIAPDKQIRIADRGKVLSLDYAGLLASHEGESWFGLAVGFRMLQRAAAVLSTERLWDRRNLFVVSAHPGDGVRDAIDYVTRCVSRQRFRLAGDEVETGCRRAMRFEWEISDGARSAAILLNDEFVADELFVLLERRGTAAERADDRPRFARLKRRLARQIWATSLAQAFSVHVLEAGIIGHA